MSHTARSLLRSNLVSVATVLMLVISACSAADPSQTPEASRPAGASQAPQSDEPTEAETIQIGAVYPLSGPFSFQGSAVIDGMRYAISEINGLGGIESMGGAQLELVEVDAGESPESAANATGALIDEGNIVALTGAWLGSYSTAMAPIAERAQMPYVTEAFGDDITEQGYAYLNDVDPPSSALAEILLEATLEIAAESGEAVERVALAGDNSFSAVPLMEALKAGLDEQGIDIVVEEQWTSPLPDTTALVSSITREDPDVVFLIAFAFADVSNILSDLRGAGFEKPVVQNGAQALLPVWLDTPDVALGLITQTTYGTVEGAEEIAAGIAEQADLPYVYQDHYLGYANIWAIKEGLEAAGTTEPEALANAIRELDLTDGPLATIIPSGRFAFSDNGRIEDRFSVLEQWQETADGLRPCTIWPLDRQVCDPVWDRSGQ